MFVFARTDTNMLEEVILVPAHAESECVQFIIDNYDQFDEMINDLFMSWDYGGINDTKAVRNSMEKRRQYLINHKTQLFKWLPAYTKDAEGSGWDVKETGISLHTSTNMFVFARTDTNNLEDVLLVPAHAESECVQYIIDNYDQFDEMINDLFDTWDYGGINDTKADRNSVKKRRQYLIDHKSQLFEWFPAYIKDAEGSGWDVKACMYKPVLSTLIVYTDGSTKPNPGPGGAGAVVLRDGKVLMELIHAGGHTTNDRMKLYALIMTFPQLPKDTSVTLYTDSEYVNEGLTEWIHEWRKNNWRTASNYPVKNQDLWKQLLLLREEYPQVTIEWTKTYLGTKWIERADKLANIGADRSACSGDNKPC